MSYTILEENSRTVLVRMPRSYIAKLDSLSSHAREKWLSDDHMTPGELARYKTAKKDLENGINIVSWEEIHKKYG